MKEAEIIENSQGQAVRLPEEFRFKGTSVGIRRIGNAVVLLPKDDPWDTLLGSLGQFSDDFMRDGRDQPESQHRQDAFE